MENSNVVFKSDFEKEGAEENSSRRNLTCLNHEVRELGGDTLDDLITFNRTTLWKGTEKEVIMGIRNDEVTGKNSIVRLNLNTSPQKVEFWDIKENVNTLSAAIFLKQFDDFKIEQEKTQKHEMETLNAVFKSDISKAGLGNDALSKNLTCLNHETQELKGDMLDDLRKFKKITLWGGTEKEVILGIRNDEVTGKNTLVRINLDTVPQKVESWDIKENVDTLSAAIFFEQYDDFAREQEKEQEYKNVNKNFGEAQAFEIGGKKDNEKNELEILSDRTQLKSSTRGENLVDHAKERIKSKSKAIYDIEEIKLDGKTFSIVNKKGPSGNDEHFLQIADNKNFRYIFFNKKFSFEEAVRKVYKDDDKKIDSLLNKYEAHERKKEKGSIKNIFEKAVKYLPEKANLIAGQIALAKKMGYVQGVCECVAVIGDDHTLGKKLLSEMNVTKDMAKKFASHETYKTLENGIFAQKQEQKLEQTHSIKR